MMETGKSVVDSRCFARSTRSCRIIAWGERPSTVRKRRSKTRRETPILAAQSSTEKIVAISPAKRCIARRTTGSPTASYELDPRATIPNGGTNTGADSFVIVRGNHADRKRHFQVRLRCCLQYMPTGRIRCGENPQRRGLRRQPTDHSGFTYAAMPSLRIHKCAEKGYPLARLNR